MTERVDPRPAFLALPHGLALPRLSRAVKRMCWWVGVAALTYLAFRNQRSSLFEGLDGSYMLELRAQQAKWMPRLTGFTSNLLQSLGNVWFPLNMNLIPGYLIPAIGGGFDAALAYLIFSIELFLGTTLVARALGLERELRALAGGLLVASAMPLFGRPLLYGFFTLVPHHSTTMLATYALAVLFTSFGRADRVRTALQWLAAATIFLHMILSQPLALVLAVPPLLVLGLASLSAASLDRRELGIKVAGLVALGVVLMLGPLDFLRGLGAHTAIRTFAAEMVQPASPWAHVSVAFGVNNPVGSSLIALAVVGALLQLARGRQWNRALAIGFLTAQLSIFGAGALLVVFDAWHGPHPHYFESYLWPLHFTYATVALKEGWARALLGLERRNVRRFTATLGLGATMMGVIFFTFRYHDLPRGNEEGHAASSTEETPFVGYLKQAVSLVPGGEFRGRVATLIGSSLEGPVRWRSVHDLDGRFIARLGNDHRMVGVWHHDIPTLVEYSPLISPELYLFSRELFVRPGDRQTRNVIMLRRANEKLFGALGVRFVISDVDSEPGANRIRTQGLDPDLHLHELGEVNVGDYSPRRVVSASSVKEILNVLGGRDFDPRRVAVLETPVEGTLTEARAARLVAEAWGWRVTASSRGSSLLLLPVGYSHCLEVDASSGNPTLLRANLIQAALLFNGTLDARLKYFTGPFENSDCRLKDAADMKRLSLSEIPVREGLVHD